MKSFAIKCQELMMRIEEEGFIKLVAANLMCSKAALYQQAAGETHSIFYRAASCLADLYRQNNIGQQIAVDILRLLCESIGYIPIKKPEVNKVSNIKLQRIINNGVKENMDVQTLLLECAEDNILTVDELEKLMKEAREAIEEDQHILGQLEHLLNQAYVDGGKITLE